MGRYDLQIGNKITCSLSFWHQRAPAKFFSQLPQPIANETLLRSRRTRGSTGSTTTGSSRSTLLNHMSMGYLNRNEGYGCVNQELRQATSRRSRASRRHDVPPQISSATGSRSSGATRASRTRNITTRPTFIINDMVTWDEERRTR